MQPIQQSPKHAAPSIVPVAIYTRVSTLHQVGGRFDSCESQAATRHSRASFARAGFAPEMDGACLRSGEVDVVDEALLAGASQ
jgi:hypothetical protein